MVYPRCCVLVKFRSGLENANILVAYAPKIWSVRPLNKIGSIRASANTYPRSRFRFNCHSSVHKKCRDKHVSVNPGFIDQAFQWQYDSNQSVQETEPIVKFQYRIHKSWRKSLPSQNLSRYWIVHPILKTVHHFTYPQSGTDFSVPHGSNCIEWVHAVSMLPFG